MASAPSKNTLSTEDFEFSSKRELGNGGFSTVFAVEYNGQEVAVKKPHHKDNSIEKEVRRGK